MWKMFKKMFKKIKKTVKKIGGGGGGGGGADKKNTTHMIYKIKMLSTAQIKLKRNMPTENEQMVHFELAKDSCC